MTSVAHLLTRPDTPIDRVQVDCAMTASRPPLLRGLQGGGTCPRARDKRSETVIVTACGGHSCYVTGRESERGSDNGGGGGGGDRLTLPSYSRRESTSGAMYAGVPTVDLGLECSSDDCNQVNEETSGGEAFFEVTKQTSERARPFLEGNQKHQH